MPASLVYEWKAKGVAHASSDSKEKSESQTLKRQERQKVEMRTNSGSEQSRQSI